MASQGFDPEDFLYFLDSDKVEKVRYIRDELHPRLREFGRDLAAGLDRRLGVTLRPQLRSGRWYKNPWGTWVSLARTWLENLGDDCPDVPLRVLVNDDLQDYSITVPGSGSTPSDDPVVPEPLTVLCVLAGVGATASYVRKRAVA